MEKRPENESVVLNKSDVINLYDAFIALCDYVEENIYCGNCPLWNKMCGNENKDNVTQFSRSLSEIRNKCGITRS